MVKGKRAVLWSGIALIVGFSLAGCGSSDSETADKNRAFAKEQAIRQQKIERLEDELRREESRRAKKAQAEESEPNREGGKEAPSSSVTGFQELEAQLPGRVGIAIGPPGSPPAVTAGALQTGSAWSTSKVPVALRVLRAVGGPTGLSSTQADQIRRALTLSDNDAATALFASLERTHGGPVGAAAAVTEVLREAGDATTEISSEGRDGFTPFGQTEWSVGLQEQFMSYLTAGCVGSAGSDEYVLELLGEVSSDTWGLGSIDLPASWKGGWGPGTDGRYLARQMGVIEVDGENAAVALAAIPDDGQFTTAQSMATELAQYLAEQAPRFARSKGSC